MKLNRLVIARKNKNLTQKEAAKLIGISYSTLTKLETGFRGASDKTKILIANFYDSTVQEIFFDNSTTESDNEQGVS